MTDLNLILKKIPELQELFTLLGGEYTVAYNPITGLTNKIKIALLKGGEEPVDLQWTSTTEYLEDQIVEYGLKLWQSKVDVNIGNFPSESAFWTEVSKSEANGFGNYATGVFTVNPSLVVNNLKLYLLNTDIVTLPFNSTDFATELSENKWVLQGSTTADITNTAALANVESAAGATQSVINGNINARIFEQIGFVLAGYDQDVTTDSQDILKSLPYAFKAYTLRAEFATAPTGSSAIVTFYKNGTSIGTCTILATEFFGESVLGSVVSFAKGDSLSAVITQIGMTIPGKTAKAYIQGIKYQ